MDRQIPKNKLTPMMQQYFHVKDKHKDHIVFFRLGDFYEMFFEDAEMVSQELGLTLTGRDCGLLERAPMCGIPYHACETYIAKLIRRGHKVAICEQVEDPAFAKGVVSREVVRVITPGTLVESNLLDEDANNYLCSIYYKDAGYGLVFADISTGEANLIELGQDDDLALTNELSRYSPREVIFNSDFLEKRQIARFLRDKLSCTADLIDDEAFESELAKQAVLSHFAKDSLEELGLDSRPRCVAAISGLLQYLGETQKVGVERLISLNLLEETKYVRLDLTARANLEILETARTKDRTGSLLGVLDKTQTPMGKRLIKSVLVQPLVNPLEIDKRLNAVEELYNNEPNCRNIIAELSGIHDLERLITRVVYGNATPREFKTLQSTMAKLPALIAHLDSVKSINLTTISKEIDPLPDLASLLEASILEEPPNTVKEGGVISPGFNPELDRLLELMNNSRTYLADLETKEKEKTGIKNLKIGFNKVFGYYFEVTKSYQHLVPEYYIRKQTLAGCERYIIQELKTLEEDILSAQEKAVALEQKLFDQVRTQVARQLHRIQRTATAVSWLDIYCCFARVALENRYVRPVVNTGDTMSIIQGRHPVVEQMLGGSLPFVPNDTLLDTKDNQIAVITGPNMAGKSTFMRQTALIVLMAQIGCFVPAKSAVIGVVDGIYTRIGAADDLSAGQSTFMMEMVEVAQILQGATRRSLLILDEIGRGTSTYDGMSIARAVIEYIADPKKLGAKTMFATHYHELTVMEEETRCVKNYNIACKKRGDDITFLRKIVPGGADDSYGIEVSKLAGIPDWIIKRAHHILEDLENAQAVRPVAKTRPSKPVAEEEEFQISFDYSKASGVEEMLRKVDLNTLTPIEALNILYQLKEKVDS